LGEGLVNQKGRKSGRSDENDGGYAGLSEFKGEGIENIAKGTWGGVAEG